MPHCGQEVYMELSVSLSYFKKTREITVDEDPEGYSVFDTLENENEEFIPGEALDKEDLKKTIHEMQRANAC